jgi:hypothetical protein
LLCDEVDVEPDDESDGDNEPPFSDDAEGDEASPTMGIADDDEEGGDRVEWADVGDVVAAVGAWCWARGDDMGDMPAPVGEECTGEDVDMRVDVAAATDGDPIRGARTATGEVGKPNAPPAADMVAHDPDPDPGAAAAVCSSGVVGDMVDEGDAPAEDLRRSCWGCVGCIREWLPALSSSSVCQSCKRDVDTLFPASWVVCGWLHFHLICGHFPFKRYCYLLTPF